jgi:hypothetical protein
VSDKLGDFTTTPCVASIALLAAAIGALSAFVALALLRLIGLFTNLFFLGAGRPLWFSRFCSFCGCLGEAFTWRAH